MRVVTIGIKSVEEGLRDFAEAFEAARKRIPVANRGGSYFTSLEAARGFLTPRRLELLHAIKARSPHSIYALARHVGRNFASVLKDLEILKRHGLVEVSRSGGRGRRPVAPKVGYEAIHLYIAV